MRKSIDILTAVDTCVDILLDCGRESPRFGQVEQFIGDYNLNLGGSNGIFASGAAKLGLHVTALGAAGNDAFGIYVRDELQKSGVDIKNLRLDQNLKTGVGFSLCMASGDRAILTYNGSIDAVCARDFTDELLQKARHLHIGSYYLMHQLRPAYPSILKRAKEYGVTVSLDTNWDPAEEWDGVTDILPMVDVFLPNEQEILLLTGAGTVEAAAAELCKTIPIVAVKQGANGASVYAGSQSWTSSPPKTVVRDTVGAGDCFDVGFIYGYLHGMPLEQCLKIGCLCGSNNTRFPGGTKGQLYKAELDMLLESATCSVKMQ